MTARKTTSKATKATTIRATKTTAKRKEAKATPAPSSRKGAKPTPTDDGPDGAAPAAAKPAKTKQTKAVATAAAKGATDDSQELVVFAFRLTRAERDLIHQAAGAAKASKLVRGVAVAIARGDMAAVQEIAKSVETPGK